MSATKAGTRWTAEEDRQLLEEITTNLSLEEIAEKHQRNLGGIKGRLLGKAVEMVAMGVTLEQTAMTLKLTVADIEAFQAQGKAGKVAKTAKASINQDLSAIMPVLLEIRDLLRQLVNKESAT